MRISAGLLHFGSCSHSGAENQRLIDQQKLDLEFKRWDEIRPFFLRMNRMLGLIFDFVFVLLVVMVAFLIYNTQSAGIVERLGESPSGISLEDLSRDSGIPKSSLHRTLAALKYRGFAVQHVENGPYFLGTRMLSAAFGFYERLDLRALVHPLLVRLVGAGRNLDHLGNHTTPATRGLVARPRRSYAG